MERAGASRMLGDRYRLDSVIGAGANGVVYRAYDLVFERPVAVKLFRSAAARTAEDQERLLREVRATARLKNAHAVTLLDVGEAEDDLAFVVTNLVAGESLDERLARDRSMPIGEAVAMALQACDALQAAHAIGIVHGGIKPTNVLLTATPTGDHVTLVDFGLAVRLEKNEFTAPEQTAGEEVDGRADQYALAATLRRALTGSTKGPVAPLPPPLDGVLRRALESRPAARFPDIAAFVAALTEARDAKVEVAPRPVLPPFVMPVAFAVPASSAARPETSRGSPLPRFGDRPAAPTRPLAPPPARFAVPEEDADEDDIPEYLSPEIWKRVLGYSALALVLAKVFLSIYLTRQIVLWLVGGMVVGATGLGVSVWATRAKK